MLHPAIEDITELIRTIPRGQIATMETLCIKLSDNYGTNITCLMQMGNAIKKISENDSIGYIDENMPFWRVIRTDKMIIKSKAYAFWATKIESEGFELSFTKTGAIQVNFDSIWIFQFYGIKLKIMIQKRS